MTVIKFEYDYFIFILIMIAWLWLLLTIMIDYDYDILRLWLFTIMIGYDWLSLWLFMITIDYNYGWLSLRQIMIMFDYDWLWLWLIMMRQLKEVTVCMLRLLATSRRYSGCETYTLEFLMISLGRGEDMGGSPGSRSTILFAINQTPWGSLFDQHGFIRTRQDS